MQEKLNKLEKEIHLIKARNVKVEADKAWETSLVRRISVGIITYAFMCVLMFSLEVDKFYLNALIPTCGYLLSTISLGFIKTIWQRRRN